MAIMRSTSLIWSVDSMKRVQAAAWVAMGELVTYHHLSPTCMRCSQL
jgi:hypothetical protein